MLCNTIDDKSDKSFARSKPENLIVKVLNVITGINESRSMVTT